MDSDDLIFLTEADIPAGVEKSRRFGVGYSHTPGRKTETSEDGKQTVPVMEDLLLIKGKFRNRFVGGFCVTTKTFRLITSDRENEDLFGVFDGHDGSRAARIVASRFHKIFEQELKTATSTTADKLIEDLETLDLYSLDNLTDTNKRTVFALHRSFEKINEELKVEIKDDGYGGTTALVAFFDDTDLYVANVGDTRAVIGKKYGKPERISFDHRPVESERTRIEASGGKVYCASVPRVEGTLAVSRVLGDFDLQGKGIIWHPHIRVVHNVSKAGQFLILASDGLWDLVSESEAANIVSDELEFSASNLPSRSFARRYSRDGEAMMFDVDDFADAPTSSNNADADFDLSSESEMEASSELVKKAFRKNAVDNISVVVVRFA